MLRNVDFKNFTFESPLLLRRMPHFVNHFNSIVIISGSEGYQDNYAVIIYYSYKGHYAENAIIEIGSPSKMNDEILMWLITAL